MKVRAIKDFTDGHGIKRKIGDEWKMYCQECARALISAGKVVKAQ